MSELKSKKELFQQALNDLASTAHKRPERAKLMSTQKLDDIQDNDLKEFLRVLYDSKNLIERLSATVLNSIFTESKATFMFSRSIFEDLIKSDRNLKKRKTLNGDEYGELYIHLTKNGYMNIIKRSQEGIRIASILELAHPPLVQLFDMMVGREFRELQTQNCVDEFEAYAKLPRNTSQKTSNEGEGDNEGDYESDFEQKCSSKEVSQFSSPQEPPSQDNKYKFIRINLPQTFVLDSDPTWPEYQQKLYHYAIRWAEEFQALTGDLKNKLFGRDNRKKTLQSYVKALYEVGCDVSDSEYVVDCFDKLVLDGFANLNGNLEQDILLRGECQDDLQKVILVFSKSQSTKDGEEGFVADV